MIRALPAWGLFLLTVLAVGVALTALGPLGVDSGGRIALDGQALLAAHGEQTFASFLTAFPPLPFLLTSGVAALGGALWESSQISPAMVAAALVGGVLALAWFQSFRTTYGGGAATVLTVLCIANPLFLMALTAGPAAPLTMLGFWMLGVGVFELRRNAIAGDAITIGVGLAIIGFSSPFGLTLAIAASPFLALAAPAELLQRSVLGFLLSMIFPLVAGILSFAMVAWIFTGDGWAVLGHALDQSVSGPVESPWAALVYAAAAILVTAPIAPLALVRASQRLQILMPTLALVATLTAAFVLARSFGVLPTPALGIAPALSLAAVTAARWPQDDRRRMLIVALLLALGAVGGALAALSGRAPAAALPQTLAADQALGRFLMGKADVLIDTEANPAVVAARGGAKGLVGPAEETFTLTLLTRKPTSALVVVSDESREPRDRVSRGLPRAYDGLAGYRLIYDREGWRVYQRQTDIQACGRPPCAS